MCCHPRERQAYLSLNHGRGVFVAIRSQAPVLRAECEVRALKGGSCGMWREERQGADLVLRGQLFWKHHDPSTLYSLTSPATQQPCTEE